MRNLLHRCLAVAALGSVAVVPLAVADEQPATRSDNPDYAAFDDDNMTRSQRKQQDQATSPAYLDAFARTAVQSHLENQLDQVNEADQLRIHATLGQHLAGGSVGNPEHYSDVAMTEVNFVFRDGAKLEGHVFHSFSDEPGPAIVITTGSIQGTQHMYWWAARTLAENGYTVFTWDVQGQGESETTGHDPATGVPTTDGVPFQQDYNFTPATIDALKFFVSTPDRPYVPTGWTADDVAAYEATSDDAEAIDWFNPAHTEFDGEHLGIAGHSLGAGSVSVVQQCSDLNGSTLWQTLEICDGTSFPIKAVIGWDRLGRDVVPVVPGMDQQADGYFFNTQPTEEAPEPAAHLAAFDTWRDGGVDTMSVTVRGGTHIEWTEIPFILPSTEYGVFLADFYTLAWFDRYVHPDPARNRDGLAALVHGADVTDPTAAQFPWRATFLSGRYRSAQDITGLPANHGKGGGIGAQKADRFVTTDLRAAHGAARVGDWAALNAESAEVRYDWDRSVLHADGYPTTNDATGGSDS